MSANLIETLEQKARSAPKRVAFPESGNDMILRAAEQVVRRGIGTPVLVGNPETVAAAAKEAGVRTEGFDYYDNTVEENRVKLAADCAAAFGELFTEKTVLRKSKDAVNCAMFLAKLGLVDCVAAGRVYTTADVIIAAQNIVGVKEGCNTISSVGILNVPGYEGPEGQMLVIADCAINASPDASELADIAISSAETAGILLGWEPRVAMLAFSTCGSSEHESIDVIREAITQARARRPRLKIDGEFQLDAALIPKSAAGKVKRESEVAGRANVLIFPNLHAGNIGVKLIQLFGKADAYGPVLQGFAKPVCDFSRSAPLSEMMGNIVMLIVRAQAENGGENHV